MEPEDIESKEFLVALRGYDKEQVRAFLTEVAAEFRKLSTTGAHLNVPEDADSAEIASVMRALVAEAVNIRVEAERDAAEIRAAAQEGTGSKLWKAVSGILPSPPER